MTVRDAVDDLGNGQVIRLPRADKIAAGIREAVPVTSGAALSGGPATVLDAFDTEAASDQAAELAALLRPEDAGVVVLTPAPHDVALGALVDALSRAGLSVLQARGIPGRLGGTLMVLSTDPDRPFRGHLSPADLTGPQSAARLRLEWALEGLALRSRVVVLGNRADALEAANAKVQEGVVARLAAAEEAARTQRARADLAEARLARATAPLTTRARSAFAVVRNNPVSGGRKIARAVARRVR